MTLRLLRRRHGLLGAWGHLHKASIARVPLSLMRLLLAVERWGELRSMLAMLLLHVRRETLVRTRVCHHVRARARRSSVAVRTCALLGHVWHLRLCLWRHGRVALVLRRHEATRGWVLSHHWRTSAHLRHVRTVARAAWRVVRTHLVHLRVRLVGLHHHRSARSLHLPVSHAWTHAIALHGLAGELRHWHLSHLAVVATSHLRRCIARAVLHAVTWTTGELHPGVEVWGVAMLHAILAHVREALVWAWVGQMRSLQVSGELVRVWHGTGCRVRCVHRRRALAVRSRLWESTLILDVLTFSRDGPSGRSTERVWDASILGNPLLPLRRIFRLSHAPEGVAVRVDIFLDIAALLLRGIEE